MIKHLKNLKKVKQKSTSRKGLPVPNLIIPKTEAESKILNRVTLGNKLFGLSIHNENELNDAKAQRKKWNDYNEELLRQLFDSEAILEDYLRSSMLDPPGMNVSWGQKISTFHKGISNKIEALESILKRLNFIQEKVIITETQGENKHMNSNTVSVTQNEVDKDNKSITEKSEFIQEKVVVSKTLEKYKPEIRETVFVVHGEDDEAENSVATFIEKLGLKAVILHEQTNAVKTIIEKFERNEAISEYAVVILTSDDTDVSKKDAMFRERQNVMFALGYFLGALGCKKVSVLAKEGLEIQNDFLGVECISFDPRGDWQLSLARDMKSAGVSFDANRIF
jgi:predicted nucleotide-binding protein